MTPNGSLICNLICIVLCLFYDSKIATPKREPLFSYIHQAFKDHDIRFCLRYVSICPVVWGKFGSTIFDTYTDCQRIDFTETYYALLK